MDNKMIGIFLSLLFLCENFQNLKKKKKKPRKDVTLEVKSICHISITRPHLGLAPHATPYSPQFLLNLRYFP